LVSRSEALDDQWKDLTDTEANVRKRYVNRRLSPGVSQSHFKEIVRFRAKRADKDLVADFQAIKPLICLLDQF
jgi:hypothetical protein